VRNVPVRGETTVYVATVHGRVTAYAPNGYVRWQRMLGSLPNTCPQLDTYGVVGTPVVDPVSRALYVADGFGLLHALDLVTGRDRAGWPVRLFDDPEHELVWGALTLVRGSVYLGTGSYCDEPMEGKLIRVQVASRRVSSWLPVPFAQGGGGSIWGWGGAAYSARRNALFVVTGNAFEGGTNKGPAFSEAAGYGEQLVELSPDLRVLASNLPATVTGGGDIDFVGSPVVFTPSGCPELVAALNKNGHLYIWRSEAIGEGPFADVALQPSTEEQPLLSQAAFGARTRSLYVSTSEAFVRVALDGCTGAHVAWKKPFQVATLHGSPTVAGSTVWLARGAVPARLRGYDAVTGAVRYDRVLGVMSFTPPAVAGDWLFDGASHGYAVSSTVSSQRAGKASTLRRYSSFSDTRHGWQSREAGVYATDDGGHTWRRIYRTYAQRVLRLSATRGVISVGTEPSPCECAQRQLWTRDGGRTWHATRALGPDFAGAGRTLFSWSGDEVRRSVWPPLHSARIETFASRVADVAPVPGGMAALQTSAGRSFDNVARVTILRGDVSSTVTLPAQSGRVLARSLSVEWPSIVVRTLVFTDAGRRTARWRSTNGGRSWRPA
jgi:hypothetical protein